MSVHIPLPKQAEKVFSPTNAAVLIGMPLAVLIGTPIAASAGAITQATLIYALIHYIAEGISITAGYHRLFAHRSYKANPIVKFFVLVLGAGAMQNSALMWAFDHRRHHRFEDTPEDPYNINKGFWWAHMGWIFYASNTNWCVENAPADLRNDKLVMWQHKYYIFIVAVVSLGIPLAFGFAFNNVLGFLVVGAFWRMFMTSHCTYLINSAAHYFGKATYSIKATARDNWFLALFTFGEGYHNFHHKFQADYRNGVKWWQFDPTKWLINTLHFLGLATDLKSTPEERILLAQMRAKKELLEDKGIDTKSLDSITLKFENTLEEFKKLKTKLEEVKTLGHQKRNEAVANLKDQIAVYKKKQAELYKQWTLQFNQLRLV